MKIEDHMTTQVVLKTLGLKEHTLYKVLVRCTEDNIEHIAFLFVGFLTGSYTEIYNQTYEKPMRLIEMYSIEVIADLGSTNDIPMTMDHNIDKAMEGAPIDNDEELFGPHEPFCDVCKHPHVCMITGCSSLHNFIDPIPHHSHESYVEPGQTHDDEMP